METLKKTQQFQKIYQGKKVYTKYFIIFRKEDEKNRYGFVTSKKVGKAVLRNRLRRLLREFVRNNTDFFNSKFSYIFVVKRNDNLKDLTYKEVYKDLKAGVKKYEKNNIIHNKNISKNI